jgi:hypothetical protein
MAAEEAGMSEVQKRKARVEAARAARKGGYPTP